MKKIYMILLVLILVFVLAACASNDSPAPAPAPDPAPADSDADDANGDEDLIFLTLEELAQFDGRGDNLAYVAIDGIIYDVTNVPQWRDGSHQGNMAGQDLTDVINNRAPHGTRVLGNLPVVGRLVD